MSAPHTRALPGPSQPWTHPFIWLLAVVATAAFLTDWATKAWALRELNDVVRPFGAFLLGLERNTGFAFSAGAGHLPAWFVIAARILLLGGFALVAWRRLARSRRFAVGFGLLLGGGAGNAADIVFRRGAVVDFIGAGPFTFERAGELGQIMFVFNGADIAIVAGVILLAPLIREWAVAIRRWLGDVARLRSA